MGDKVAVGTVALNEAEAALIAFGLPIVTSLAVYFLLTLALHWPGDAGKTVGTTLLSGGLALFLVFGVDRLLRVIYPPSLQSINDRPELLEAVNSTCS